MAGWRLLSVVVACLVLLVVVEMMRRRKLREKYAGLWILVGIGVVVFGIFPNTAQGLADMVGVQTASNFVFFLAGTVLAIVCLHLSSEVGHLEEETRTAVEEIALLRTELERARAELDARITAVEDTRAPAATRVNGTHATTAQRT
ncbi:DUF2304 domain-containing protein [Actinokineospora sp. NBRC 105648]|uniref:DUF2304 domain-containing protein n=1 Tax=Actinokineospora sp. NBRC 105648 TaxID=3032206 RepID=UPI0024A065C6|nr:DUF2304 domain-containing protein [Actinokineospora sp. NBRC 105648]GLZ40638.1 hypothetical protein Acsp05_42620 [Actinokineospora sp. NBRC 105648]